MFVTEKELSALISEVEKEFSSYLAKAEDEVVTLAKAEDETKDKKEDKPEAKEDSKETKPEAKDEAPAQAEAAPAAPKDEQAPPADAAPAADASQMPAPQSGHGYDEEDLAHMEAMYASMSREELIAHHDAVKKVLDGMGMENSAAPAAPQMAAPEMAPPMAKSETDTVVEVKPEVVQVSKETELLKSELTVKDGKIQELQKTLDAVTAFVTKLVATKAAPAGKAITQLDTIAKSESEPEEKSFTKDQVTVILNKKASDPKLEKSDREAINQYYATGQINLTGISHLLK